MWMCCDEIQQLPKVKETIKEDEVYLYDIFFLVHSTVETFAMSQTSGI